MRTLFLLLLALFMLQSCDENPTEPSRPDELLPLAVGNYWIYQTKIIKSTYQGNQQTSLTTSKVDTLDVVEMKIADSDTMFILRQRDGISTYEFLYLLRYDGIYVPNPESGGWVLKFKYPIRKGDKYNCNGASIEVDNLSYRYANYFEQKNKKFYGVGIRSEETINGNRKYSYDFYSPGIGGISFYSGWNENGTSIYYTSDLVKYYLNK